MTDQGLTGQFDLWSEIQRFSQIPPASTDTHVGLAGERTQRGVSESLKQEIMFFEYVPASGKKAHSFHQTLKMAFYQEKKSNSKHLQDERINIGKMKHFPFSCHILYFNYFKYIKMFPRKYL